LLSGAKWKAEESSTEGSSSDLVRLTSPRVSPAKSRACRKEEKKEEEEASDRAPPPVQDVKMQDPPQDEGAVQEVPAAGEVSAIEARRTQAESSEWAGALRTKGEDKEGDGTVSDKLVTTTKLDHEWVGVSSQPLFL
jgi:hypothetical protein